MEVIERTIPVPWGHVSAKIWGNAQNPVILCFHGVLDNAGTFDRLIPLMPQNYRYACIDLPGHGRSSHFPANLPVYTLNYIPTYSLIMEFFGQKSYNIIAHSYGGQIAMLYAQLYPERVEKLILLDTIHLFPVSTKYHQDYLVDKFEQYFSIENKLKTSSAPKYTYEQALERLRKRRNGNVLSREAAKVLLDRALVEIEDGKFQFSGDQRLKNFVNPVQDFRYIVGSYASAEIKCPILMILGKDSEAQQMFMKPLIKYFKNRRNVLIKKVDGDHDVHNESPQLVVPYIAKFLLKNKL